MLTTRRMLTAALSLALGVAVCHTAQAQPQRERDSSQERTQSQEQYGARSERSAQEMAQAFVERTAQGIEGRDRLGLACVDVRERARGIVVDEAFNGNGAVAVGRVQEQAQAVAHVVDPVGAVAVAVGLGSVTLRMFVAGGVVGIGPRGRLALGVTSTLLVVLP